MKASKNDKKEIGFKFDLVGTRSYVRGTDILRALRGHFADRELKIKFQRPLNGDGILSSVPQKKSAARVLVENEKFWLINAGGQHAKAPVSERSPIRCHSFRLGRRFFFFFPQRSGLEDQLEACINFAHPKVGSILGARQVHVFPQGGRRALVLTFKISFVQNGRLALIRIRSIKGLVADVEFFVRGTRPS